MVRSSLIISIPAAILAIGVLASGFWLWLIKDVNRDLRVVGEISLVNRLCIDEIARKAPSSDECTLTRRDKALTLKWLKKLQVDEFAGVGK